MIRVVIIPPDAPAYTTEIKNELHRMQEVVGGYIETVRLTDGIMAVCNEEGRINKLKDNWRLPGFVGTVFLTSSEAGPDGEMLGLDRGTAENWVQCVNCGVLTR